MTPVAPEPHGLNLAGHVACTEAEGPRLRYAVWVQGCPFRCEGCCHPDMLPFTPARTVSVGELLRDIDAAPGIDGVTFLGGEPFAQAAPLAAAARGVRSRGRSVLVFTGYTVEELRRGRRADWGELLAATDLLVDGRFEQGNPSPLRFVGSANQRLHPLTARGAELARGFEDGPDVIEVRIDGDHVAVNGTPSPASIG